jgi:hypothetical protein
MAFFTERRVAVDPALIPSTGDRRRPAPMVDARAEEAYWRMHYTREPYYERGYAFEDYLPAYRTGWEGRVRYHGRNFEQAERELARDYQRNRGNSLLDWRRNRHAAQAAWERVDQPLPK